MGSTPESSLGCDFMIYLGLQMENRDRQSDVTSHASCVSETHGNRRTCKKNKTGASKVNAEFKKKAAFK